MNETERSRKSGIIARLVIWSVVLVLLVGTLVCAFIFGQTLRSGFPILSLDGCGVSVTYNMDGYTEGETDIAELVNSLDVSWAAGQVSVTVSPDTQVLTVREKTRDDGRNSPDASPLYWKLENGKLFVRYCKAGLALQNLKGKILEIVFPAAWLSADAPLCDGLNDIDINVASANVYVDIPIARTVNIDSASGTVEVHGHCKDMNIDTASGAVTVKGGADQAKIDTASGRIAVYGDFRTVAVDSASGRVELYLTSKPDDIDVDTASGSVTVGLPGDIAGFELDVDTASGSVKVEDFATIGTRKHCVYGNGHTDIDVDTASGSVRVFRYDGNGEGRAE